MPCPKLLDFSLGAPGAELLPDALIAIGVRRLLTKIRNHIGRNGHRRSLTSDRIWVTDSEVVFQTLQV